MKREHTKQYYLSRLEVEKTSSKTNCKKQITNTIKVWANDKGVMKAKCLNITTDLQGNTIKTNYKYYYLGLTARLMYYIYFNSIDNLSKEELKYLYENIVKEQSLKIHTIR